MNSFRRIQFMRQIARQCSSIPTKFCKNCIHFNDRTLQCGKFIDTNVKPDVVNGLQYCLARDMRAGRCGIYGIHYDDKKPMTLFDVVVVCFGSVVGGLIIGSMFALKVK